MKNITVEEAAKILNMEEQYLLFLANTKKQIPIQINEEHMQWEFVLQDILEYKESL